MGKIKVKPPRKWMSHMRPSVKKQYPKKADIKKKPCKGLSYAKAINCIIAGIWHDYADSTKLKLIKKYDSKKAYEKVKERFKMGKKKKKKAKKKGKKWGKIGSPKSAKRKRFLAKIRKKR